MTIPTPETLRDRVAISRYVLGMDGVIAECPIGPLVFYDDIPKLSPEARDTILFILSRAHHISGTDTMAEEIRDAVAELQALP